jgi:hypothetical protein
VPPSAKLRARFSNFNLLQKQAEVKKKMSRKAFSLNVLHE